MDRSLRIVEMEISAAASNNKTVTINGWITA
jgi:hypothetical protein